ncbi:hypothetical protein JCM33374_g5700 [Metschnikowia sp. JCM 33374]|nr:hypothetical protein JCM33374_g5700 [Metschnikowia sp. JCM 33374]
MVNSHVSEEDFLLSASHRILRLNSSTRVGRNHDYKHDPTCVYIADLKVPKTYITINIGPHTGVSDQPTCLSARFESICTTDVNGRIYKLAKKEAEPFEKTFRGDDLLFKVNANKSDRIKIRIRWVPIVVLPFSKKISFDGVVQQSPLPETISKLIDLGIDLHTTENPLHATHYVSLTDVADYNLQIAVSRAVPVVSNKWCDFLASSPDDVDSWIFSIRPDLYLPDTKGFDILPNSLRPELLRDQIALILADDVHSKQAVRLKDWLHCLSASEVIVKSISEVRDSKAELEARFASNSIILFHIPGAGSDEVDKLFRTTNTVDDLWSAVLSVNIAGLQLSKPGFLEVLVSEKRPLEEFKESVPLSQRRKRRRLERVEDTNFFSFTPLSSSRNQSDSNPQSGTGTVSPASQHFEQNSNHKDNHLQSQTEEETRSALSESGVCVSNEDESNNLSVENQIKIETETQSPVEDIILSETEDLTPLERGQKQPLEKNALQSEISESVPPKKAHKSGISIVPEVSLADAIKSTKQQADKSIEKELSIDESVEAQLGKLLVIEEFDLKAPSRNAPEVTQNGYHNRKNFKNFRKKGPKQNNITRTFIELVDNGNAVYFNDECPPPADKVNDRLKNDFAAEMEDVRGFQPEPSQLFVDEASGSDGEQTDESFSFSSKRNGQNTVSRNGAHDAIANDRSDAEPMSEDDNEDDIRFTFSRKV